MDSPLQMILAISLTIALVMLGGLFWVISESWTPELTQSIAMTLAGTCAGGILLISMMVGLFLGMRFYAERDRPRVVSGRGHYVEQAPPQVAPPPVLPAPQPDTFMPPHGVTGGGVVQLIDDGDNRFSYDSE